MSDSQSRTHPRVEARDLMYENPYQQVYKVRLNFESFIKEIFVTDFGERVGVVAEGPKGILLTRQYRHLIDRVSWEVPGGKVDRGEDLVEAARRECLEETGVLCHELNHLLMFHPGLDTLYNPTHLFHARAFEEKALPVPIHHNEVCAREWVPLEKCIAMISSQTMVDSLSVIALLSYNAFVRQK